jgi:UDP-2-acetamido-2,6-beta-L-arabino-hexul-4-ose reductase
MKTIGITGQDGFVGSYLYNKISLLKDEFSLIPFDKNYFESKDLLDAWVIKCDVIVHLAAMNRHPDAQLIHNTNIKLVNLLIDALDRTNQAPHVLFSSSTQEERENLYGQSKREGRALFSSSAKRKNTNFSGMVVPNVFGPFGKPFYNSVIATFCYQLCTGHTPTIEQDGYLKLIYVEELVDTFLKAIRQEDNTHELHVPSTYECYVSGILEKLLSFKNLYLDKGIFPALPDVFTTNLFNTYRSYLDYKSYFPFKLKQHVDNRGAFVEMIKLQQGGQVSFSTTVPGITRGNHFHTRKIERFLVIKGKALIQLRKYNTQEIIEFELNGNEPSYVDMPVWYTHNIKNIGEDELYTVFWINEFFDPADPDTYFENV